VDSITTGPAGGSSIQNLSYSWDKAGNLSQRQDLRQSLTEVFYYDNLHRLDYSTLNGGTNLDLSYDALGNITWKSDVGSYTYHASKKHAVTAAGSYSFAYDANGNVSTRNGLSISSYSFNLPNTLSASGNNSSQFFYAPDRSRWKQVASFGGANETTIYIGGLIEKVTGSITSWRHLIAGGAGPVAVYTRKSTGVNELHYLTKDHLGSVDSVTTDTGAVEVRLSYASFGSRRQEAGWSGSLPSGDWNEIADASRRGFTFHEMLDNLSLIHMNGRVYDPVVGRFISADPYIPAPGLTQSFNRYSYVKNNPLTLTDPTGYAEDWGTHVVCRGADLCSSIDRAGLEKLVEGILAAGGSRMDYASRTLPTEVALPSTQSPPDDRTPDPIPPMPKPEPPTVDETVNVSTTSVPTDFLANSTVGGSGGIPRLVIGFRGMGIGWLGLEGDTPSLAAFVEELGGEMYEHGPFSRAAAVRATRDSAEANPNGQIVLTGYSRGGRAAFVVANALGDAGIGVQALILFDPHDLNDSVLRLELGNVANALNFYQQNPARPIRNPFSGRPLAAHMVGSPNHRWFTPKVIGGHNYTGELDVSHLNIVSRSLVRYEEQIREALGP
jgi:RHS repeat-associated protein